MKILALDTSTENCSAALWLDGELISRQIVAGQRHSELILPMLQELLGMAGVTLRMLSGIAFGAGPGSFTGLRIGCGVAQGLAFGADLPVAAISTLQALAAATPGERAVVCLDARMGEVYHAAYENCEGVWAIRCAPTLCRPQEVPALPGQDWQAAGSGFAAYGEVLLARYAGQLVAVNAAAFPQAREMALLAVPVFGQGLGVSAAEAAPFYVRDKVALKTSER